MTEPMLAERFGVSRTPVREAFNRRMQDHVMRGAMSVAGGKLHTDPVS
jgi:DNA-binding FadR family transcriptional regulator